MMKLLYSLCVVCLLTVCVVASSNRHSPGGNADSSRSRGHSRNMPKDEQERQRKYDHEYGKPLRVKCNTRRGEAVYRVESAQEGGNFDRVWKWGCRRVVNRALSECKWTEEINKWNGPLSFMCPSNKVMTGLSSVHTKHAEDRQWKIQCCRARGYHTEGCTMTKFLNTRGEHFSYETKSNCRTTHVFTGLVTSHYTPHDRLWKVLECALTCDEKTFSRSHYRNNLNN